ncbi:cytochrome c biogenesis CcdA family protein [Streptomyces pseudovenezuelae]|uniref:cytochrome c biogenesis CcdA family protein n=1 Tax=Streptomyces pseudovenezuelae TaxID=67350 RepID=UPI002E2F2FFD|nr:cytochrome c biogenesis protein CcdA [Streptomyces pseudovenezuelae]
MGELLFGTTLLASFLGGVVALLAPCCVSVMLPAYLATGFRRRTGILAATLVFAAGVATVIVPIGLGATALVSLISGHHLLVFSIGGAAMAAGGIALLAGWKPQLPMIAGRAPAGHGFGSVYGLGIFSGAASSCCAPVLAGVAVLSGAAASFPAALAVSLTYVAGMVTPLCLIALVWDRRDWSASRLLQGRQVTLGAGRLRRRMALGSAASGILLIAMGALTLVQAVRGPDMASGGWRVRVAADLQHAASVITKALGWLPGWALAIFLLALAAFLVRQARALLTVPARRSPGAAAGASPADCCDEPQLPVTTVPTSVGEDRPA